MRKLTLILLASISFSSYSRAQVKDSVQTIPIDKSPADFVYYPMRAAFDRDINKKPMIRVIYSRPQKKGREIFGNLEDYGKVWRTGANESTEIKFYNDVKIGDKIIKAGEYSLFTIPYKDKWTVIINSVTDKWGAYFYDKANDIARIDVPVKTSLTPVEAFTILFKDDNGKGAKMLLAWDNVYIELPVKFNQAI